MVCNRHLARSQCVPRVPEESSRNQLGFAICNNFSKSFLTEPRSEVARCTKHLAHLTAIIASCWKQQIAPMLTCRIEQDKRGLLRFAGPCSRGTISHGFSASLDNRKSKGVWTSTTWPITLGRHQGSLLTGDVTCNNETSCNANAMRVNTITFQGCYHISQRETVIPPASMCRRTMRDQLLSRSPHHMLSWFGTFPCQVT